MRLFVDFMIVRKLSFSRATSDDAKLRKSSCLRTMTKKSLEDAVNNVINLCKEGGFDAKHIDADFQFECAKDSFSGMTVEICDVDDYIKVIEMSIRTMKEGIRVVANDTPTGEC